MAVTAMKRGAVEFLEKPIEPQTLIDHATWMSVTSALRLSSRMTGSPPAGAKR
jgi:FixJ family two-component response regulator